MGKRLDKVFGLEVAEIKVKAPRKTLPGFQNLLIREFPITLMEKCKRYSRKSCGTSAVLESLENLFQELDRYREMELKYKDTQSDLLELRRLLWEEQQFEDRKRKILKEKVPGQHFQLHGD